MLFLVNWHSASDRSQVNFLTFALEECTFLDNFQGVLFWLFPRSFGGCLKCHCYSIPEVKLSRELKQLPVTTFKDVEKICSFFSISLPEKYKIWAHKPICWQKVHKKSKGYSATYENSRRRANENGENGSQECDTIFLSKFRSATFTQHIVFFILFFPFQFPQLQDTQP